MEDKDKIPGKDAWAQLSGQEERSVAPLTREMMPGRDWPEDSTQENGNYMNTCHYCEHTFTGYKRRLVCKRCDWLSKQRALQTKQTPEFVSIGEADLNKDWVERVARAIANADRHFEGKPSFTDFEWGDDFWLWYQRNKDGITAKSSWPARLELQAKAALAALPITELEQENKRLREKCEQLLSELGYYDGNYSITEQDSFNRRVNEIDTALQGKGGA